MKLTLDLVQGIRRLIEEDLNHLLGANVHVLVEETPSLGLLLTCQTGERTATRVFRRRTIERMHQWGDVHADVVRDVHARLTGESNDKHDVEHTPAAKGSTN